MVETAIRVQDLWQAHVARWILRDISFDVYAGEIAVLTGVNGVGKTTLLTTIAGMTSPAKGAASVFGCPRCTHPEAERHVVRGADEVAGQRGTRIPRGTPSGGR